jgi:hypothetical protein
MAIALLSAFTERQSLGTLTKCNARRQEHTMVNQIHVELLTEEEKVTVGFSGITYSTES